MGVRDSIAKFLLGSEFVAKAKAATNSSGMVQPSQPLPPAWAATTFAPGWPITPAVHPYEDELPREIDYPMAVNVTLVPRTAYGLMPFSALASVYETVAEVNMCVFTLIREMGNFEPKLVDEDGNPADDHPYVWLTESPDRVTPWVVWLTRFLQSVLVFDSGAFYIERDGEELKGLHFLDGSTILLFVDEHGRTPEPPAPAYGQVIKGMPFSWWTREAVWYKPRFRRYDAPYGRTPIEQAWPWILTIANITGFELAHYREGNLPEGVVEAPEGASLEQIAYYEEQFNARMSSGAAERMRVRFLPPGFSNMRVLKKADFPEALYKQALQNVALAFGLPQTEFGNVPGQGLGGRGFMDVMDKTFYRMALGPLKSYVCSAFNDVLAQFGVEDVKFDLKLPQETLDPKEAQNAVIAEFNAGLVKLNEARSTLGYDPVDGGDVLLAVQGGQVINISQALAQPAPQPTETPPAPPATGESGTGSSPPFQSPTPVTKFLGVDLEDDLYYGSPVEQAVPVPLLGHHRNDVEIVTIKPVGLSERPALWKPLDGEHPGLIRRIGGWQGCREEAAYLIDRMLGLYLVPVAYLSDLDGERGAVLYYVPGNDPAKPVAEYQERWLEKAALLDTVLCNLDRHSGNWLTHPDDPGRPVLIDNGLTFPATEHMPSSPFVVAWGDRPFSMSLLVKLEGLTQDRRWQRIKDLVGDQAAALTEKRIKRLLGQLEKAAPKRPRLTPAELLRQQAEERAAYEARIGGALAQDVFAAYHNEIVEDIMAGREPDWAAYEAALRATLEPELARVMAEQLEVIGHSVGIDWDHAVANERAVAWAREHGGLAVSQVSETTRKAIQEAVSTYLSTPGMKRQQLLDLLEPTFGEARASAIATTEVTQAYAEATNEQQAELAKYGLKMHRIWNTAGDELVCPICGPLDKKPESEWADEFPDGPPAHTNCRCAISLELDDEDA